MCKRLKRTLQILMCSEQQINLYALPNKLRLLLKNNYHFTYLPALYKLVYNNSINKKQKQNETDTFTLCRSFDGCSSIHPTSQCKNLAGE